MQIKYKYESEKKKSFDVIVKISNIQQIRKSENSKY